MPARSLHPFPPLLPPFSGDSCCGRLGRRGGCVWGLIHPGAPLAPPQVPSELRRRQTPGLEPAATRGLETPAVTQDRPSWPGEGAFLPRPGSKEGTVRHVHSLEQELSGNRASPQRGQVGRGRACCPQEAGVELRDREPRQPPDHRATCLWVSGGDVRSLTWS